MNTQSLMCVEYASGRKTRSVLRPRWMLVLILGIGAYVGSYFVLRPSIEPAVNLAFFVYPGSMIVDKCCYYGFWPLYKVDRFLTRRKHNLDRTYENPTDAGP